MKNSKVKGSASQCTSYAGLTRVSRRPAALLDARNKSAHDGAPGNAAGSLRLIPSVGTAGRAERAESQYPIAAVLSCSDSRVAPELAFDQGPGDLFVVRLAGNFANEDGLASLEYAVKFLGVPLVMVLGHSNCGALSAAIKVAEDNVALPGHLPGLVRSLKPAVEAAKVKSPHDLLAAAITENVALNVKRLETAEPSLASFAQTEKVKIVGGVYDLATGKIGLLS